METTAIVIYALLVFLNIIQGVRIRIQDKHINALTERVEHDNQSVAPLLDYCLKTIRNQAIRDENYEDAARAQKCLEELNKI